MIDIQSKIPKNSTIIIGFSGGPDSICLLTLLSQLQAPLNLTLIAAHLDHGWRSESTQDASWCKEFCTSLGNVTFESTTASALKFDTKYNGSKEEHGRKLRRAFFNQLAQKYNAHFIALAHHADDQQETFFIRLIRGSSITGLSAMKEVDGLYLRPLLQTSKQEILQYLTQKNIPFLTDHTNNDLQFLRNKIRHQLIPEIIKIDARSSTNIDRCITHLQKTDDFLHDHAQKILLTITNNGQIDTHAFLKLHEIMQHRILLSLLIQQNSNFTPTSALFDEIIRFLKSTKHTTHQINTNTVIAKQTNTFSFKSL